MQDYLSYCKELNEPPKSVSSLTEMFSKKGVLKKRRAGGIWYYLEVLPEEEDQEQDVLRDSPLSKIDVLAEKIPEESDLPF